MMTNRPPIGTSDTVTYRPKPAPVWLRAGCFVLAGLTPFFVELTPGVAVFHDLGAAVAHSTGLAARSLLLIASLGLLTPICIGIFGAVMCFRQWRGTNCVTVTADRIRLAVMFGPSAFGAQWAEWSSLAEFVVARQDMGRLGAMQCAKARIVGPGVSRNLRRKRAFVILAMFPQPIAETVAELNALRPRRPANDAAAAMPVEAEPQAAAPPRRSKVLALLILGALVVKVFLHWHGASGR